MKVLKIIESGSRYSLVVNNHRKLSRNMMKKYVNS